MNINLLTQPLITADLGGGARTVLSLPGIFAGLMRDEILGFPALRPHQAPALHCFLAQLGALALHHGGRDQAPDDSAAWERLLRGLTPGYAADEPWHLVVADGSKPAFLQPPEPQDIRYTGRAETPDAADMLIGQKNHDLKSRGYHDASPEDWIFALISKQTGDGFNGSGNYGIARMNGGSSSRFVMGLVPLDSARGPALPGARLRHDIALLLRTRSRQLADMAAIGYPAAGGKALLWLEPWPLDDKNGLALQELDIWFIEICRRIRLRITGGDIQADMGTSQSPRVNAKALNGVVGDPWALVHKDGKTLTLGEGRFSYAKLSEWLFGGDWKIPLSVAGAELAAHPHDWLLILQALGRGNSKTYGYQERQIMLPQQVAKRFPTEQETLRDLSRELIGKIGKIDIILRDAVAIMANGGRDEKPRKDHYGRGKIWRERLDALADQDFFPTLWELLSADLARDHDAKDCTEQAYLRPLIDAAHGLLTEALNSIAGGQFRLRGQSRAERMFRARIRKEFSWYYPPKKETADAAA